MKILILLSLSLSLHASDGGSSGAGNGGDYIRMKFIDIGNNIVDYYTEGFKEIKEQLQSPEELRDYLDIKIIKLSTEVLTDNGGSKVDAIGEPNSITLYEGKESEGTGWYGIYQRNEAEKLVLHEMLRAHGINDDNYVYSKKVLKSQDILKEGPFRMKWSRESHYILKTAMLKSFDQQAEQEQSIYNEAFKKILKLNNLRYSSLLQAVNYKLDEEILEKIDLIKLLTLKRKQIKTVLSLIPTVDKIAYQDHKEEGQNLKKLYSNYFYFLLKGLLDSHLIIGNQDYLIENIKIIKSLYLRVQNSNSLNSVCLNFLTQAIQKRNDSSLLLRKAIQSLR